MTKLAIIGFGNQAKAWALNLKDSNVDFSIGLRQNSKSKINNIFSNFDYEEKSNNFSHFVLLTPDETHQEIISSIYKQNNSATFIYAHGYSIETTDIIKESPLASHILLAPKSIASELRIDFELNGKIPAVYSLEHSKNKDDENFIKELAKNIGITSLSLSTFKNETNADLFSEQTLLCSAIPYLALHSFNTLIKNGVDHEIAFYECFHELKSISSAFVKMGPTDFFNLISPNALIGSQIGQKTLFDAQCIQRLDQIYSDIENGNFNQIVNKTDLASMRDEITSFWSKTQLQKTYDKLKSNLY